MSRIIAISTLKVKATRHSARPVATFGEGVFTRRQPFTAAEYAATGELFSDYGDWAALMLAGKEACEACGRPVHRGELRHGLCDCCEARAEEASMASLYYGAGLAYACH